MDGLKEQECDYLGHSFKLLVSDNLFMPNTTTKQFPKMVVIEKGNIVYDIGTGQGAPLAIWSAYEPSNRVYASEIVHEQCEIARENVRRLGLEGKLEIYHGSLFKALPNSVKDYQADVIIGDVSGMADKVGRILGWYPESVPTGGRDGTEVVIPFLKEAGKYLRDKGRVYFPIISLSDHEKIMDAAQSYFKTLVERIKTNSPLSDEQVAAVIERADPGTYEIEKIRSRHIWKAWFMEARDPR